VRRTLCANHVIEPGQLQAQHLAIYARSVRRL
jgi:hypothetical protein